MTCGQAMDRFYKEYQRAKDNPIVKKPIAYALYQTWKYVNYHEKERSEVKIGNTNHKR